MINSETVHSKPINSNFIKRLVSTFESKNIQYVLASERYSYIKDNHKELYFKENTYAFGNGTNDIEMLSTVGCGIAMGNASDAVKKYANEITEIV